MDENPYNSGDGTNNPDLSRSLKPRRRAISDDGQLKELITSLEQENRERNTRNARIMAKYNAEKPYKDRELTEAGLDWRSNFSTQPLSTLIDRVAPRFARVVQSARYLTAAKFPAHIAGADDKTETFRKEVTSLFRSRDGWKSLISEIAQENSLFGYTLAGFTDEKAWFPRHFRQDEFYVPGGTKQSISACPMVVLRETLLPHELFELIEDYEAAEAAGWEIENAIDAVNKAMPDDVRGRIATDERKYEDMVRETNLYASFAKGAKVIVIYHAFVTEVTGQVSHYIVDGRSWKRLFGREDQFDSMKDLGAFFSFQQANGKLQASKGIGRTVYAMAGIIDRSRNEVVDRFQMSGKVIVQGPEKELRRFSMSVIGSAIVISDSFEVTQHKIESGVEAFIGLDNWVLRLMDEIAGSVSPAQVADQIQGERPTNGQINLIADLNNEGKDTKIERFVTQLADLFSTMQRRAYDSGVIDQDARDSRARCLEIMTEEELDYIRNRPAAETVDDLTDRDRQIIIAVTTEVRNDPLVNAKKALEKKLTAAVSAEFAKDLLLPDNDPTETAEQTRWSRVENLILQQGLPVDVSPRDNPQIHLAVLLEGAGALAAQVAQDPSIVETLQKFVEHGDSHVQIALGSGVKKDQLANEMSALDSLRQGIQVVAQAAAAQLDQQAGAQVNAPIQ